MTPMTTMHVPTRSQTTRRMTLALLAALTVTLGAIAAPLAGTAHAGGAMGGVDLRGTANAGAVEIAGRKPGVAGGRAEALATLETSVEIAGRKPGVAAGSN